MGWTYLSWVLSQALSHKVLERQREGTLQDRGFGFRDEKKHAHWVILGEGRLPLGHFDGGDAQTPHICLGIVSCLPDNFWCHPEGRANESVPERVGQLRSNPKVCELNFA